MNNTPVSSTVAKPSLKLIWEARAMEEWAKNAYYGAAQQDAYRMAAVAYREAAQILIERGL